METNKEIAKIFKETARLLTIKSDSSFRINAYLRSASVLERATVDVADVYKEKGLAGIKNMGIGEKNAF